MLERFWDGPSGSSVSAVDPQANTLDRTRDHFVITPNEKVEASCVRCLLAIARRSMTSAPKAGTRRSLWRMAL